jgi:hypothetical protein
VGWEQFVFLISNISADTAKKKAALGGHLKIDSHG